MLYVGHNPWETLEGTQTVKLEGFVALVIKMDLVIRSMWMKCLDHLHPSDTPEMQRCDGLSRHVQAVA